MEGTGEKLGGKNRGGGQIERRSRRGRKKCVWKGEKDRGTRKMWRKRFLCIYHFLSLYSEAMSRLLPVDHHGTWFQIKDVQTLMVGDNFFLSLFGFCHELYISCSSIQRIIFQLKKVAVCHQAGEVQDWKFMFKKTTHPTVTLSCFTLTQNPELKHCKLHN